MYNSLAEGGGIFAWFDKWWMSLPLSTKIGVLTAMAVFVIVCFAVSYNKA